MSEEDNRKESIKMMEEFDDVQKLKAYYEDRYAYFERPSVTADRKAIEEYFITGTLTDDEFLEVCDDVNSELWDDLYDTEWGYIDLHHYMVQLQRITGKKPKYHKPWNLLKIETLPEELK